MRNCDGRASGATGRTSVIATIVTGLLALLGSGCMGGQTAPGSIRDTGATAPADLQLLCAGSAATSLGVDNSKVLPVSSSQLDAEKYQVVLDAGGTRASCIVDANGNVLSVQRTS